MSIALDIVQALVFGLPERKPAYLRESPILGVDSEAWRDFVKCFVNAENSVTDHFRYGIFEFTVKRMCDLGLMVNPETTSSRGRLVWVATWVHPLSLRTFLADHARQYEAFCQSMAGYASETIVRQLMGVTIDDTEASLSGLLAVAHRAGLHGLESWVSDPKERAEFSHTTTLFKNVNGIF